MADGPFLIGQPEVLLGFPPGGGGTQRLARLLGSAKALRLCLDGGPLGPREAHEIGLVDEVVPAGDLVERALVVAGRLARRPKAAIAAVKRAVYLGGSEPLAAGLRRERAEFLATITSPGAKRAMAAYVERLKSTSDLPAYDRDALERALEHGVFD
jgi:enoyl-CoA hydratase